MFWYWRDIYPKIHTIWRDWKYYKEHRTQGFDFWSEERITKTQIWDHVVKVKRSVFFFFNQDKGVLIMPLVYCFNTKDASVSLLKQSS